METWEDGLEPASPAGNPPGIVIRDRGAEPLRPRIAAFIWGGRIRPLPTLPFGRWKATAA